MVTVKSILMAGAGAAVGVIVGLAIYDSVVKPRLNKTA